MPLINPIVETGATPSASNRRSDETEETTIMTKLSAAQNKALAQILDNEWRTHRKHNDSQIRNTRLLSCGNMSTLDSLIKKKLLFLTMGGHYRLYRCGRQAAIDILHENAAKEMETFFADRYRALECKHQENLLRAKIVGGFDVDAEEVTVHLYSSLRTGADEWTIRFDLMSIDYSSTDGHSNIKKGYYVNSRSSWLQGDRLADYIRILSACQQIIESCILEA